LSTLQSLHVDLNPHLPNTGLKAHVWTIPVMAFRKISLAPPSLWRPECVAGIFDNVNWQLADSLKIVALLNENQLSNPLSEPISPDAYAELT
jgi:hypothetical protein